MNQNEQAVQAIEWKDPQLKLLDQRQLPQSEDYLLLEDVQSVYKAIKDMVVRGAPAIGITAAYGVVFSARLHCDQAEDWRQRIAADIDYLGQSRPTAVNLFWALEKMTRLLENVSRDQAASSILKLAQEIHLADYQDNKTMGELGADLIARSETGKRAVLTHCNAGALATGGYGTALGVIRSAFQRDLIDQVYADETRPWMQGARLTAWELIRDNIPCCLLADSAAAHLMKQGKIAWVIVGADRIAANGDVANKIGTYQLAIAARYHGVKFMVAAPTSTIDMKVASGADIPIEERNSDEVLTFLGSPLAAVAATAINPVFDVTPAELVDAIVTEKGVVEKPNVDRMAALFQP